MNHDETSAKQILEAAIACHRSIATGDSAAKLDQLDRLVQDYANVLGITYEAADKQILAAVKARSQR